MRKRTAICLPLIVAFGAQKYPFVGKWELQAKSGSNSYLCDFIRTLAASEKHMITPFVFSTVEEVKRDGARWIVSVRNNQNAGPPVVFKDVTSTTMTVEDPRGTMQCAMKKVGACTNVLCN
jgi:hypothetical protein